MTGMASVSATRRNCPARWRAPPQAVRAGRQALVNVLCPG